MLNPFLNTPTQKSGHGTVHLALLPPSTPVLQTLTYQYPLKLISPAPSAITSHDLSSATYLIHTLYILTYGGGIVAGDKITLNITLEPSTRLILLTQGSTKIFKSPSRHVLSRQDMRISVEPGAGLCYLPDPVQPFERSAFEQEIIYDMLPAGTGQGNEKRGSICVLDWVSCGRAARGEYWDFWQYGSKNEIYLVSEAEQGQERQDWKRRLLLRDNLRLDVGHEEEDVGSIANRMEGMHVFGTLLLYGPLFSRLAKFFMAEFKAVPRLGARKWDTPNSGDEDEDEISEEEARSLAARRARQRQEVKDGLIWSAAAVRGVVVVKFGAREVEGGKRWIKTMIETEGSVLDQFGERALMCLR
ncbi:UreD urease accessory protein-domain-containing protein [Delphinella strobiligena]|nr:UreD urease accessory protein-domain-containing protein [Delphinella strobiligena]